MRLHPDILALAPQMTAVRREIHQHPELALEEHRTARLVAETLRRYGLEPVEGVGGTGVVCVIEGAAPGPTIALRADMDALPMNDESGAPYASPIAGKAHACGHDGHTAALVGIAAHLAQRRPAKGRVVTIFQPAEENGLGAKAMIDDGLFERFPFDEIYAFHNMPMLKPGQAAVKSGPCLNGFIVFEIEISGVGGHGAAFYKTVDPLQAAARLAVEVSSLVGRYVDPQKSALVTLGKLQAGATHNIIPESASLSGTVRSLSREVLYDLFAKLEQTCDGIAALTGCKVRLTRTAEVPPCVNDPKGAAIVADALAKVLGEEGTFRDHAAYPFTDDLALMLEHAPGAYMFLGQESVMCHNPAYDFDDQLLPVAASIYAQIIEDRLGFA